MDSPASALPRADGAITAQLRLWLSIFAAHVRAVDYAAARPMWHPDLLAFGTHRDVMQGLESAIATQWDNVWPKTARFDFDLAATEVLASPDRRLAVVVAPWTSQGFAPDGTPFDRPGRATMVFDRSGHPSLAGGWRCIHSHLSLNRGVPQTSHGARPVRGR